MPGDIILDLFEFQAKKETSTFRPLAERMRPKRMEDFMGQDHIAGPGTILAKAIENDRIFSMILWGPPGCGKTTLASIIAEETHAFFVRISAVLSNVKEVRSIIDEARSRLNLYRKRTILFVDEIHRFNKAQQDAFLGHVESGLITLIGATTENPSFEVIPALLSRCRVLVLEALSKDDINIILKRAVEDEQNGLRCSGITIKKEAMDHLAEIGDGDVRAALNGLEIAASFVQESLVEENETQPKRIVITVGDIESALQKKALLYDKTGEEHYNLISALHKSMRGSDPDASIYWLTRMLDSGEDPVYIGRRMVRFASEDVGNADSNALRIALDAVNSFRLLGRPEGELALVQAAVYLATAPKSNSLYVAHKKVKETVRQFGALPVPKHIRNAPTTLMKKMDYGKGYQYAHDHKHAIDSQSYLPDKLEGKYYYFPTERGYEATVKKRLDKWRKIKRELKERR
jgi:putative ATPase